MKATTVNKSNYEVHQFIGGHYGICEKGSFGGNCVFGGDSADEDAYDKALMDHVFNEWDGSLNEYSRIEL